MELLTHKSAKVVACAISVTSALIQEFGTTHAQCKGVLSALARLFSETDKGVRAESSALAKELYRWLGPPLNPYLSTLKPVQLKELSEEFSNIDKMPPAVAKRKLITAKGDVSVTLTSTVENSTVSSDVIMPTLDTVENELWESAPAIDISTIFPTTIEKLLNSTWKEKKDLLDALGDALSPSPRLKLAGGYFLEELISAMGRLVSTDLSIAVVLSTTKCIERIAAAAKSNFPSGKHPTLLLQALIGRTREKKNSVIDCLMTAADSMLANCIPPITFQVILEAIGIGTGHVFAGE